MKKKLTTTIREYRIQNNMSQQELADLTGVRRETMEKSTRRSVRLFAKILDTFRIVVDMLR